MNNLIFPGTIAVMGGGSWATALAKLLLINCESIVWYMRRDDRIADFRTLGHNPAYLTDVSFDVNRIHFTSDISEAARRADTLLLAMPSPYFLDHVDKIDCDLADKFIVSAIKGMVPECNELVTGYMTRRFDVPDDHTLVIGGPCHAEEVALDRPAYLTIGSNLSYADTFARCIASNRMHTICSTDVDGIEYASVLKNIYAIAAGIVHGNKTGDNFTAVLVSNAVREMKRFLNAISAADRDVDDSVYLGDLLVTAYSRFSRNHNFGSMIGRGYSVRNARCEMDQTAEGYYGTRCIYEINSRLGVDMPILDNIYNILYRGWQPYKALQAMAQSFT